MTPGSGAWYLPDFYHGFPPQRASDFEGKVARNGVPYNAQVIGFAMVALKKELAYNGFKGGMVLDNYVLGDAANKQIRAFQAFKFLDADGQLGPRTAKDLFRKRVKEIQAVKGIPDDLLCKMTGLESGWDPGAIGRVDNNDHGLVQINAPSHPDISIEEAIDPQFCLNWAANSMASNYTKLKDWDGVLAAHNLGNYYAGKWVAAGKPASGGTQVARGDVYTLATQYVALVRRQTC